MRILISGGTGYVGNHLIPALQKGGHKVATLTRNVNKPTSCDKFIYEGKIEDIENAFTEFMPDHIVHLAADLTKSVCSKTIDSLLNTNIKLLAYLLEVSKQNKISRFINISTYSTSVDGSSYSPQTFYAATKKAGEDLCEYYSFHDHLDIISLCLYDVYGPNQPHARFLNSLIASIKDQKPFSMSKGEQEICLIYIDDVVEGIMHALSNKVRINKHEKYSLYGHEVFQLKEVPALLASHLNLPPIKVVHEKPYRAAEIMSFSPLHPLLSGWMATCNLQTSIRSL